MTAARESTDGLDRRCHAVLVEVGSPGPLGATAGEAFDQVTVTSPRTAMDDLVRHRDIAVLVVDDSAGTGTGRLLDPLRATEPSLPIVLISGTPDERATVTLAPGVGAEELRRAVHELPAMRTYEDALVSAFATATVRTLEAGFGAATVVRAFHKTSRRVLAEVNAAIDFHGEGFTGWVCIAADLETLGGIYGAMFEGGTASAMQLEDLAGEMSNHVAAGLRRWLPGSRARIVSVPEIVRGDRLPLGRSRHCLTLELESDHGPLFCQLHFETTVPIELEEPSGPDAFQML